MKTLFLDIETSPATAHVWSLWNVNVGLPQLLEPGRVLGFGAKFSGEKTVRFWSEFHNGKQDMVAKAHALLDEADAVVHYNGTKFDIPHLNREFAMAGLKPPSPYRQIDLLRVVKKQFRFDSNKLQHVSTMLGFEGKVQHSGHSLWVACLNGDPKAWATMKRYCRQDVQLLEDMYPMLLPWIAPHPNVNLFTGRLDEARCTRCGSDNLQKRGTQVALTGTYARLHCQSCGGWMRATKRESSTDVTVA